MFRCFEKKGANGFEIEIWLCATAIEVPEEKPVGVTGLGDKDVDAGRRDAGGRTMI